MSSFQLDDIQYFKPEIAILLNITEDHLDRYNYQFENYIKSKGIVNEIYGSYFTDNFPARETVEVSCLPKHVNVEISCVAVAN